MLVATFVWPAWLDASVVRSLWAVAGFAWVSTTAWNHVRLSTLLQVTNDHGNQKFLAAQIDYLRGNWFEAEAKLLQLTQQSPRDAEALLLLVGVLRRTGRVAPALRRLQQLELLESASCWQYEISQERMILEKLHQEALNESQVMAEQVSTESTFQEK